MPIAAADFDRLPQTEDEAFADRVVRVLRENQALAFNPQEITTMLLGRAQSGVDIKFILMAARVEGALDGLAKEGNCRVESKEEDGPFSNIFYRAKRQPAPAID